MLAIVAILIFGAALSASAYAIGATVMPRLAQIGDALAGRRRIEARVLADRRAAVRRWAAAVPRGSVAVRAAA